jgi:hypothetical protein
MSNEEREALEEFDIWENAAKELTAGAVSLNNTEEERL